MDNTGNGYIKCKTQTMVVIEAKQNIIDCINSQNLNVAVLEMILKDIYNQVSLLAVQQYEKDKQEYENACKNTADGESQCGSGDDDSK